MILHLPQTLNPVWEFGKTVTAPIWEAGPRKMGILSLPLS
jgi:hypothetical protein